MELRAAARQARTSWRDRRRWANVPEYCAQGRRVRLPGRRSIRIETGSLWEGAVGVRREPPSVLENES